MLWLKEGDNTKFFHCLVNSHCRHHREFSGGSDRDQTIEFYQHLYTEAGVWRPLLDGMPFQLLMMRNLAGWIIALRAVKNMSEDKVLGSDEFMMAFFKACWSILKWTWYI